MPVSLYFCYDLNFANIITAKWLGLFFLWYLHYQYSNWNQQHQCNHYLYISSYATLCYTCKFCSPVNCMPEGVKVPKSDSITKLIFFTSSCKIELPVWGISFLPRMNSGWKYLASLWIPNFYLSQCQTTNLVILSYST